MSKLRVLSMVLAIIFLVSVLASCNSCDPEEPEESQHIHAFGDWIAEKAASCTEAGSMVRYCDCGEKQTQQIAAKGHHYVNEVCTECGVRKSEEDQPEPPVPPEEDTAKDLYILDGSYIYFGSYPQSAVTDVGKKAALEKLAGDPKTWTSYRYYVNGKQSDFMVYTDVEDSGSKYRGIYFTAYRPLMTQIEETYVDKTMYALNTVYWFKYEPIRWKMLDVSDGEALLLADMILDSREYSVMLNPETDPKDYEGSSVRAWLNGSFLQTAFSEKEQEIIVTSLIENSVYSTGFEENAFANDFTEDKVFLLSYANISDPLLGLSDPSMNIKKATSYAQAQGILTEPGTVNGFWWLRSPSRAAEFGEFPSALTIATTGEIGTVDVSYTSVGVVPALQIELKAGTVPDLNPVVEPVADENGIFEFGSYPQTLVTDSRLTDILNGQAAESSSYNYYSSLNYEVPMYYKDVEWEGERYRGVWFNEYRPRETTAPSVKENSNQGENGFEPNIVYWFRFEPIRWRLLKDDRCEDAVLLIADLALDCMDFDGQVLMEPADYPNASIRNWLNVYFFNTAFSISEQQVIRETVVSNYDGYGPNVSFDCVFLLSSDEASMSALGFDSLLTLDAARVRQATDYAKMQGIECDANGSPWLLRSPLYAGSQKLISIKADGGPDETWMTDTFNGIVPALYLSATGLRNDEPVDPYDILSGSDSASYFYFGSYPQTLITDTVLVDELNRKAADDAVPYQWYPYYANGNMTHIMSYLDIEYNGEKYRNVSINEYRPFLCGDKIGGADSSSQSDYGYMKGNQYWFRYDPILWRILDRNEDGMLLLSDMVLDGMSFNPDAVHADGKSGAVYDESFVRTWLNTTFMDTAFDWDEMTYIAETTVRNDAASTGKTGNPYACGDTTDYIFLLSAEESCNSAYGFSSDRNRTDPARSKMTTAYAQAQGAGCGWLLRSPSDDDGVILGESPVGNYCYFTNDYTCAGITPALWICFDPFPSSDPEPSEVYKRVDGQIYFGEYPTREVSDESILAQLNTDTGAWYSYDYYVEGKKSNFMQYKDVTLDGKKYRGVIFTQNRPSWTSEPSETGTSFQTVNGYSPYKTYWFAYEPLVWNIIEEFDDAYIVMANGILDSQSFQHTYERSNGHYINDYEYSDIRLWLNGTFLNTAFSAAEQEVLLESFIDNSAGTTCDPENPFICANTSDRVYLPSYREATVGMISDRLGENSDWAVATDYARIQGLDCNKNGRSAWWLRSPGNTSDYYVEGVTGEGNVRTLYTLSTYIGVVPVIMVKK